MKSADEIQVVSGRVCAACGLWKPAAEFHRSGRGSGSKSGLYSYCKPWQNARCREKYRDGGERVKVQKLARRKEYMKRHPDRVAANTQRQNIKKAAKRVGVTVEEVLRALAEQDGCAICGREEPNQRLALDHDHRTGKFRGLLCQNCNQALGKFRDDPALLRRAAQYIEEHHAS